MKTYIGTKMVMAEPEIRMQKDPVTGDITVEDGYKVRYTDGYESWSPKAVFERTYLEMIVNPHLKTDRPSISQQMVEDFIVVYDSMTMGDKCTVVKATLANGFEIVESSACVSKENYDRELGEEICMGKIRDKVWFLLGFLLQTAVSGVDGSAGWEAAMGDCCPGECCSEKCCEAEPCGRGCCDRAACAEEGTQAGCDYFEGHDFGWALHALKQGVKMRRRGWNGKNQHIELASAISYMSPTGDVVNAEHDAIGNQAIAFCGTSGVQLGWLASQADMLAEDWELAD